MIKKTNAARLLDRHKVSYELLEYKVDEDDLSAIHVAELTGVDIKTVFKTLVCLDEKNQPLVACIAGDDELDLKALAKAAGCKKCTMLPLKDVLKTTGYIRGGCSPFGMKKLYPTFLDESALSQSDILVSAGQRGLQLKIKPQNILDILNAKSTKLVM
ncbi:Cys-tRNA(Pro) deacylase [Sulfurospirillum arcachonense]|uniref:Cys-tRNA(Pro) deacylase n=1 Tax=Sulfurospirillum arcachonense TaxID=57666 RepID=UPI000468B9ED|nr:Cys-tRNA(Pro) deacylase [Sulfurospirillum arcachonense]